MDAKVIWNGKLAFSGSADSSTQSGLNLALDTDTSVGGEENGFRPMELLAIGLAGCTAMDVISILNKKRQEITGFEVRVHASRAGEHPKVFTAAVIEYDITGHNVDEAAVIRSIELSASIYCPAQAMFSEIMPIALKYHIFEAGEDGQRSLVASGKYRLPEKMEL